MENQKKIENEDKEKKVDELSKQLEKLAKYHVKQFETPQIPGLHESILRDKEIAKLDRKIKEQKKHSIKKFRIFLISTILLLIVYCSNF